MYKMVLAGCLLALGASTVSASSPAREPLDINSAAFSEQRVQIEKQLADGKTYAEISVADRAKVTESLNRLSFQLENSGSTAALNEREKNQVFNDQETINTILTRAADDSRVVCTRENKVGTHRPVNVCLTVAERRLLRERSQDTIRKLPAPQLKGN